MISMNPAKGMASDGGGGGGGAISVVVTTIPTSTSQSSSDVAPKQRRLPQIKVVGVGQENRCCGHWFPSVKTYHRHLAEKAQTDSAHEMKLLEIGMLKCLHCTTWVHVDGMSTHLRRNHGIIKVNKTGKVVSDKPTPDATPVTSNIGPKVPNFVIKVSGQNSENNCNGDLANSAKSLSKPNTVKFVTTTNSALFQKIKKLQQANSSSSEKVIVHKSMPKTLPFVNVGPRLVMKTIGAPKSVMTLGSNCKVIPPQSSNAISTSVNGVSTVRFSTGTPVVRPTGTGTTGTGTASNYTDNVTSTPKILSTSNNSTTENVIKKKVKVIKKVNDVKSKAKISEPSQTKPEGSSTQILSGKAEASLIKKEPSEDVPVSKPKSAKKGRKQVLKPTEPEPSVVNQTPESVMKVKKRGRKPNVTPEGGDKKLNSVNKKSDKKKVRVCDNRENYTPKSAKQTAKGTKLRGSWNKKKRGPGRPRKIPLSEEEESSDLSSDTDSLFDETENENLENKPIIVAKVKKEDENIPTVELDLFTLPSLNEQISVLLTEPKNPNFKVYASMDAIFVGDSALGDVTNQIGYVTDANNVVFVNPGHFLFPNIEDLENFVPSPILTMKGSKSGVTPIRQVLNVNKYQKIQKDSTPVNPKASQKIQKDSKPVSQKSPQKIQKDSEPVSQKSPQKIQKDSEPVSQKSPQKIQKDSEPVSQKSPQKIQKDSEPVSQKSPQKIQKDNEPVSQKSPQKIQKDSEPVSQKSARKVQKDSKPVTPKSPQKTQKDGESVTQKSPPKVQIDSKPVTPKSAQKIQKDGESVTQKSPRKIQKDGESVTHKSPPKVQIDSKPVTPKSPQKIQKDGESVTQKSPPKVQIDSKPVTPKSSQKIQKDGESVTQKSPPKVQIDSKSVTPKSPQKIQKNSEPVTPKASQNRSNCDINSVKSENVDRSAIKVDTVKLESQVPTKQKGRDSRLKNSESVCRPNTKNPVNLSIPGLVDKTRKDKLSDEPSTPNSTTETVSTQGENIKDAVDQRNSKSPNKHSGKGKNSRKRSRSRSDSTSEMVVSDDQVHVESIPSLPCESNVSKPTKLRPSLNISDNVDSKEPEKADSSPKGSSKTKKVNVSDDGKNKGTNSQKVDKTKDKVSDKKVGKVDDKISDKKVSRTDDKVPVSDKKVSRTDDKVSDKKVSRTDDKVSDEVKITDDKVSDKKVGKINDRVSDEKIDITRVPGSLQLKQKNTKRRKRSHSETNDDKISAEKIDITNKGSDTEKINVPNDIKESDDKVETTNNKSESENESIDVTSGNADKDSEKEVGGLTNSEIDVTDVSVHKGSEIDAPVENIVSEMDTTDDTENNKSEKDKVSKESKNMTVDLPVPETDVPVCKIESNMGNEAEVCVKQEPSSENESSESITHSENFNRTRNQLEVLDLIRSERLSPIKSRDLLPQEVLNNSESPSDSNVASKPSPVKTEVDVKQEKGVSEELNEVKQTNDSRKIVVKQSIPKRQRRRRLRSKSAVILSRSVVDLSLRVGQQSCRVKNENMSPGRSRCFSESSAVNYKDQLKQNFKKLKLDMEHTTPGRKQSNDKPEVDPVGIVKIETVEQVSNPHTPQALKTSVSKGDNSEKQAQSPMNKEVSSLPHGHGSSQSKQENNKKRKCVPSETLQIMPLNNKEKTEISSVVKDVNDANEERSVGLRPLRERRPSYKLLESLAVSRPSPRRNASPRIEKEISTPELGKNVVNTEDNDVKPKISSMPGDASSESPVENHSPSSEKKKLKSIKPKEPLTPTSQSENLSPPREWHGRGAKLKAQVLIKDQQAGVTDSKIPCDTSKHLETALHVSIDASNTLSSPSSSVPNDKTNLPSPSNISLSPKPSKSPKSPSSLQNREWQARGAKLKAQVMISDPNSVVEYSPSSVISSPLASPAFSSPPAKKIKIEFSSPTPVSPVCSTPPAKKIKIENSPGNRDIRSFFAVQKSPQNSEDKNNTLLSPQRSSDNVVKQKTPKSKKTYHPKCDIRKYFAASTSSTKKKEKHSSTPKADISCPPKIIPKEEIVEAVNLPNDFEGFERHSRPAGNRAKSLMRLVSLLKQCSNVDRSHQMTKLPFPLDQLCVWNDEVLDALVFTKEH